MKRRVIITISLAVLIFHVSCSQVSEYNSYQGKPLSSLSSGISEAVNIHIIYDNYVYEDGMKADWGYSILIKGLEKSILFDTGTSPNIFESNFNKAGLDAGQIDEVFISHNHGDHTGGLGKLLSMNPDIKVVVPKTFNKDFFRIPEATGSICELISESAEICDGLYSTGVMGVRIPELALVLNTKKGLVVMTGCSHPGIIQMLKQIKEEFGKNIYMVFGGFHLMENSDEGIQAIIQQMNDLGVVKCGATHCTGDKQIELFRKAFGNNFVEMGAGNIIIIE